MKRHCAVSTLLLCCFATFVSAQYPTAIGTSWSYFQCQYDDFQPGYQRAAFKDIVVADSAAAGMIYHVVNRTGYLYYECDPPFGYDTLAGTYCYRVNGAQVWVLDSVVQGQAYESLLYDFSLTVGDTAAVVPRNPVLLTAGSSMHPYTIGYDHAYVCENIPTLCDSVLDVHYRTSNYPWGVAGFSLTDDFRAIYQNDIGMVQGYPYTNILDVCGQHYFLDSLVSGGQVLYVNPIRLMGVSGPQGLDMELFPNPTSGHLQLRSQRPIRRVWLVNAFGQVVDQVACNGNLLQMDLTQHPRGLYWLRVQGLDGEATRSICLE